MEKKVMINISKMVDKIIITVPGDNSHSTREHVTDMLIKVITGAEQLITGIDNEHQENEISVAEKIRVKVKEIEELVKHLPDGVEVNVVISNWESSARSQQGLHSDVKIRKVHQY